MQYSTFCYQIEETNFSLFGKIYTNAAIKFGNRYFFKDMNFYGHELFRTISDSWLFDTFISGSENHKLHDNFSFILSISIMEMFSIISPCFHQVFFNGFEECIFEIFRKLLKRNSVMGFIFCYDTGLKFWNSHVK